ncbi:MAG: phage portal protein, partial [Tardiphaga sp.]|nr:phage portal protein [Tardiphaga sp.]
MSQPPKLLSRIAAAVSFVTTGRTPAWFGPAAPIAAQAPPETAGRRLDYPVSANLQQRPRADEEITADQLRALAENCDIVALAIQTRKDQLTGGEWQFQLVDKTARGKTEDPRLAMLEAFWKSPDQEHSWEEWISAIVDDLLVLDAATVYPRANNGGGVYGFDFIDGGTIKRVIDPWGRTPLPPDPAYQQVLKGLSAVNYTADELLYAPRNLRTHKLYGYSPVQQIAMTVNVALRRQMATLEYYTAGSVPDALAGTPEAWSADQVQEFQRYWDSMMADDNASRRRLRFVPGAIAKAFTQTKEAALKDAFDEWLARVVSYAFSLSPQWAVKEMNRSTAETGQAMANAEGLAPLRKWVATLINRCVKLGWGWDDIEFSWLEEEETNPQAQAEVSAIYLKLGVITINEVRADLGRDPIDGGDVPMIFTATGGV